MKCVLLNIKNVTCDKKRYNVTSTSRVGGINMFSSGMRFVVFSRFQSSDFPIECHVTDILRHGTGVNARRRAEDHETRGHGDNIRRGDTGHWSEGAIITALQGYNHQANVSPCLLSPPSCNMQTTADSLQINVCVRVLGI